MFDPKVWKVAILTHIIVSAASDFCKQRMRTILALEKESAVVQGASE